MAGLTSWRGLAFDGLHKTGEQGGIKGVAFLDDHLGGI